MSKFVANSFQVPNAFIDEMLDKISGNACKIYLLIVRKTRGWNKEADRISYSQIQKCTGINSRTTISKALDELLEFGLIMMQNGSEKSSNEYRLNDDFASPKNGLDKNCTSPKNGLASPKNGLASPKNGLKPSPKNGHTEIHIFKNTYTKNNSEYTHDEHTQKNSQNSSDEQSDKPTKKTSSRKNFIKPTFDEVKNYFSELNNHDPEYNAHKFINYYQSINWVIGRSRTPMKDWKAAVRNWALNDSKQKHQAQGASHGTHHQSDAQAYAQELHRQYQERYGNNGNTESNAGGHATGNVYDMEDELWL